MNPLVLFDYVYYSIAYLYANMFDYDDVKEFAGKGILSTFQLFNMIAIVGFFYKPLKEFEKFDPIFIYILGYFFFLTLNFIRYKKFVNYSQLADKWDKESGLTRLFKIVSVICYFILSIFLFVYS